MYALYYNRAGYKGGALTEALKAMDRRAEYVVIFDADAMPFPDALQRFLPHFYAKNGHVKKREEIAAVQSYQWHVLNKSESWLTEAVRTEYAGSYMVERPFQDMLGSLKMIAGTAYMIRAELLRELGWGKSLTEDWELTLRLYARGYKVVYTPYAETPAECVSTFGRLARQRMRWAEGHSYNVRKWFGTIMRSPQVSLVEKFEFALYSTYYLQAVFFVVGSLSWGLAEIGFRVHIPDWTALLGWSLLFSNLVALPMMNLSGLLLEEAPRRDLSGVLGAWALSLGLVPYQGYAALKGLFEKEEGPWFRTPKTGRVTDEVSHLRKLGRVRRWLLGAPRGRVPVVSRIQGTEPPRKSKRLGWIVIGAMTLALGGLGLGAVNAPVAQAAGSTLYLHAAGPYTMDTTTSAGANRTFSMTAAGATRTWATTTSTAAAQTFPTSATFAFNYWTAGAGTANANLTLGYSASAGCVSAIAKVQAGPEVKTTTGPTITGTLPAASTAGDLLVATITDGGVATFTGPSGWKKAAGSGSAAVGEADVWYYENNAGGLSSFPFGGSTGGTVQITEWSGAATVGALDTTGSVVINNPPGAKPATATASSGLTTGAGELGMTLFDANPYPTTWTSGAGWTNLYGDTIGDASDYRLGNAAGQTVSETMTSNATAAWIGAIATFRPQPSVTTIAKANGVTLSLGSNLATANFSPAASVTVPAGSFFCYTVAVNSVTGAGLTLNYDAAANPTNLGSSQTIFIPELGLPLVGLALVAPVIGRRKLAAWVARWRR